MTGPGRNADYTRGCQDTIAVLMACASAVIDHYEATAATLDGMADDQAKGLARLMRSAAEGINAIVAAVQSAQTGATP